VQEAAAWAIYELALKQRERGQAGAAEWTQAESIIALLSQALNSPNAEFTLLWACSSALRLLVESMPCRGNLFVANGGAEAALVALRAGQSAGPDGSPLIVAGMQLITALVDGNAAVAQKLRALGALDVLVACGLRLPGKVTDETMWTLGQVGGILAVLQVMNSAPADSEAVGSGLRAIAKLAWLPLEEGLQQQFPQAAEALVNLTRRMETSGDMSEKTYQALGGVLHVLAPRIVPGAWTVMDDGVSMLIEAVGPGSDASVAQAAVASIGHIAALAPPWRTPLQRALGGIGQRMRLTDHSEVEIARSAKHQKNLFWASAVIAGLPVVLEEMRSQANSPQVQDAAISAIVDILEDHTDSPACGSDADAGSRFEQNACASPRLMGIDPKDVPNAISSVASAMRGHGMHEELQWSGCHALGLLHHHLPVTSEVPPEALECVLAALKRHPNRYKVCSGAAAALRSFLEPRGGRNTAAGSAVLAQAVAVLRSREIAVTLRRLANDFCASTDKALLEDALYVLGLVDGVQSVLQVLRSSDSSCAGLRSAGLKTLFELARAFPDLAAAPTVAREMHAVAGAIAQEATAADIAAAAAIGLPRPQPGCGAIGAGSEASEECVEILRRAELLRGLLAA